MAAENASSVELEGVQVMVQVGSDRRCVGMMDEGRSVQ